jgi:WD40 repeat protein
MVTPMKSMILRSTLVFLSCLTAGLSAAEDTPEAVAKVSYHKQIRRIFQAHCQGCHQPAKPGGKYVMTDFARLFGGGESEEKAIVAGKPDESHLVSMITPENGEASMPKGKKPLSPVEIELVRNWIAQGASDDTPPGTRKPINKENPPVYSLPPVIASLDFSPDGTLLAVAGFHEVLLHKADGSGLVARLIGLSQRIESVRFSPDGKRLAVTGGQPGRVGEVQVWDVAKRELLLSHSVTYDTVYGASWSPDGKLISFGCSDNTVRAINSETGEQVMYQGAHSDWVRDTAFTVDSSHVLSVARDMTVKLTEVATNRFIDNVTSITPKALKGGVNTVVRHPDRDEIVVGGADGVPKIYRVFRITARKIGDDSNLVRNLLPMTGRVFCVAVSPNGKRIAAVSALDGKGELAVYSYEFDTTLPAGLKAISAKRRQDRNTAEQQKLDAYRTKDIKRTAEIKTDSAALYTVAFHPNNSIVAAAGSDGLIRLIETETGKTKKEFLAAPVTAESASVQENRLASMTWEDPGVLTEETLPKGAKVVELTSQIQSLSLGTPFEYSQLLISAKLSSGDFVDVTRQIKVTPSAPVVAVSETGFVRPLKNGDGSIRCELGGKSLEIPVKVSGFGEVFESNFIRDVNPVLSRVGCNQGTCHGSAKGKNGFKLSLRGYDPIFDVRALTDDLAARRTNLASPDDSLMLLKATGRVPHVGSLVFDAGEPYYEIVRNWVAGGAKLDLTTKRVVSIDILPKNPVIQQIGAKQQIRIIATFADGKTRDVTREAFIVSGNTDTAEVDRWSLMTAMRRGESPILARYEGAYSSTTLTVMGDRTGFVWKQPETWGEIDNLVANKWERMKIQPSELCTDAEFLRRIYLDLAGLPPTAEEVKAFLADKRETRVKRAEIVEKLIGSPDFVEYWTNKWADLLQVNRKYLGPEGSKSFRDWIRTEVDANTPYNEFVRKIITADGSNKTNPAASYYKILRNPEDIMENTTHLFLGVRFNCNKCHDHPFERWTQDQYYETAAYFARVGLKADPASGKRRIGGTAVEGAKPFYEIVFEKPAGDVTHIRTNQIAAPTFPYESTYKTAEGANRRQQLAAWITAEDNKYFAKSYVNRLWGYLHGVGIMEPIDDIRAGNPPTNPELLAYLTEEFISSKFNVRHVLQLICKSRAYQLSLATNQWNEDDSQNYSHAMTRRLPAEVLFDAIHRVTGAKTKIPGVPEGTRAAAIPDSGIRLTDGFLANLGRPARESACECERSAEIQLGPIMALIGGPTVGSAIADPGNAIAKLAAEAKDDRSLINEIFIRVLNRPAAEAEIDATIATIAEIDTDHQKLLGLLADREAFWKIENPKLEKARADSIAKATAELKAYETKMAPQVAEAEKKRQAGIAAAAADLKAYEDAKEKHAGDYLAANLGKAEWHPLEAETLEAVKGVTLQRQADQSIFATGKANQGAYTITFRTELKGITGFRIEAVPVPGKKGSGPGIPENGNFVVTEFEVQAAPGSKPAELKKVALQNAKADFLQAGFNIGLAIDGNAGNQNAWAIANAGGVVHWATFETKQAISFDEGTLIKVVIHQNHPAKEHLLAGFRISATTTAAPVGLSLPESLKAIALTKADQQNETQKQTLLEWFEKSSGVLAAKRQILATANAPLPVDPGVTKLKEVIAFVSKPVPEDARLIRLRKDVEFSVKQQQDKRLTMAQDVTWALINNPAFLFNH